MKKKNRKFTTKEWVEETLKKYGKLALKEPWICLFLTEDYLKKKYEKKGN